MSNLIKIMTDFSCECTWQLTINVIDLQGVQRFEISLLQVLLIKGTYNVKKLFRFFQ